MRFPRATTRMLMAIVLGSGLLLGLGLPAAEVYFSKATHAHGFMARGPLAGAWAAQDDNVTQPFWPRYRLRMMGQPWKSLPACLAAKTRPGEICRIEHPENFLTPCLGTQILFSAPIEMRRIIRAVNGWKPDPRLESLVQR